MVSALPSLPPFVAPVGPQKGGTASLAPCIRDGNDRNGLVAFSAAWLGSRGQDIAGGTAGQPSVWV